MAEQVLAVRVTTRSKGWNFDNMDSWSLSGIYRDVTVFALPQVHLKDYPARATEMRYRNRPSDIFNGSSRRA